MNAAPGIADRAAAELRVKMNGHNPDLLSHPTPLVRPVADPEPYPVKSLGPILGPAALAIAERVQAPEAIGANAVLAVSALAAQAHGNVETLGEPAPLSLYIITVADSGERKSTADKLAMVPIDDYKQELRHNYKDETKEASAQAEAFKVRQRDAREKHDGDPDALVRALREIAEPPQPRKPFLTVQEPTAEGLFLSLKDGQFSQGIFSDEGGSFIGGFAMSDESQLRTIALLSRLWGGDSVDRVRAKDREHATLCGRRLSLHLMAQPDVAARLLGNDLFRNQGFTGRLLVSAPLSLIGSRKHRASSIAANKDDRIRNYWQAISALLHRPALVNEDQDGLDPPRLRLNDDAHALLATAYDEIEAAQVKDGSLSQIREFASKAAEHACRIAGILTLVKDPGAMFVMPEEITQALELVQFYIGEQLRLVSAACLSIEIGNAQKLLDKIRDRHVTELDKRWVMQYGPSCIRDATAASKTLGLLNEHGWIASTEGRSGYHVTAGARELLWSCSNVANVASPDAVEDRSGRVS